jgi:hypothetical protein
VRGDSQAAIPSGNFLGYPGDGGDTAEHGEGGFAAQSAGVGAGGDEQLGSGVGSDAVGGAQGGVERGGQGVDLGGQLVGVAFEELDALRQGLAGDQHRHGDGIVVGAGAAAGQCFARPQRGGITAVAFAELGGGGDEEVFDLLDRRGAGFDCAAARDQQGFECAGGGVFGHGQAVAG